MNKEKRLADCTPGEPARHRARIGLSALLMTAAGVVALAQPPSVTPDSLRAILADAVALSSDDPPLPVPSGTDPRYGARMPAISEAQFVERASRAETLVRRLSALPRSGLPAAERIDAEILERQLREEIAEIRFRTYLVPFGSRSGFHISFAEAAERASLRTVAEYDRYIARLQSFREYTARQIALMRRGLALGMTTPKLLLARYDETIRPVIVDEPEQAVFYAPIRSIPPAVAATDGDRIRREAIAAIRTSVVPAYRELLAFLETEYRPNAQESLSVQAWPDGRQFYEHRVRRYTTLAVTPEDVHRIGLEQVARIRREMDATMRRAGYTDMAAFIAFLRSDARFRAGTPEDYLKAVAYAAKRMDGELPRLFKRLPRTPYGIRAIPDLVAPRQSAGFYSRGAADGSQAGFVNINTSELHTRPLYVAEPLAFHEGVPGHHLQIMLALENPELSEFRRRLSTTVFVEGWGLYAERLGREVGFAADPFAEFGLHTYQIWRAVRLVVDTGIHAFGWTRDRAIAYMAEHTGFSLSPATAEVDRHITEAGQGLAYTIGELKISALRRQAEAELGGRFDLREFHEAVLRHGSIPLDILEREVRHWIAEEKTRPTVVR
jgi:uncharacterized protein (DUF885 family)